MVSAVQKYMFGKWQSWGWGFSVSKSFTCFPLLWSLHYPCLSIMCRGQGTTEKQWARFSVSHVLIILSGSLKATEHYWVFWLSTLLCCSGQSWISRMYSARQHTWIIHLRTGSSNHLPCTDKSGQLWSESRAVGTWEKSVFVGTGNKAVQVQGSLGMKRCWKDHQETVCHNIHPGLFPLGLQSFC